MERLERHLRESLRQRAGDVEATPALWQEVDRRIGRRRRAWAWAWSLAATAAVLAAVVVVPAVLETDGPPGVGPVGGVTERTDPTATLPSSAVVADGDGLTLLELATGRRTPLPAPDGRLHDVAVRPGTTPGDDLAVAYTASDGRGGATTVGVIDEDGDDRVVTEIPSGGVVDPTVVWSPDGEWIAWSTSDGGARVGVSRIAGPVGPTAAGEPVEDAVLRAPRGDGPLTDGLVLTDWAVDGLAGPQLFGAHVDGFAVTVGTDLDPGDAGDASVFDPGTRRMVDGLLARVDASPARDGAEGGYALADHGDGTELVRTTAEGSVGLPLPDGLGDGPVDLDAASDAVTLSDGTSAWLVTHDGAGDDARVADLGDATAVSLVREAGGAATEDDAPRPTEGGEGEAPAWSTPLLTTDAEAGSRLALLDVGTGRSRELASLDRQDGHVEAVAVRPGSSAESLTAVLLARTGTTYELRRLHVDGDDVACCELLEDEAQVDMEAPVNGEHSIPLPVWSPSGDALAWVEWAGGTARLRTVAWDGRRPADDVSRHRRVDLGAAGVDRPVTLQDWVVEERAGASRRGVLYLTDVDPSASALTEVPVTTEQGATEVTGDAFRMGTDVIRALVDHAGGVAGEPGAEVLGDPADARVLLEWDPGSSAWLTFGRAPGAASLPDDYLEGMDLGLRPWLTAAGDGAVTGVGDAIYRVDADGEVTTVEPSDVAVTHADIVD